MFSWVALERITARRAASDAKYRKKIVRRPLRADATLLTDAELLAKLQSFGIDLDRAQLEQVCDDAFSAEEVAGPLLQQCTFKSTCDELEGDWIWICIAALWQRWFPDKPCFEALDDKMQAGYEARNGRDVLAACGLWLDAWADVLRILDKAEFESIGDFDRRFRGTESLFNWIQDFEASLWNAGLRDRRFLASRVAVCQEAMRRFEASDDELLNENRRRALAESYFELGDSAKTDALYREWLENDPQWGWGWIGWSDCYRFTRTELQDQKRSEQLLLEGLSVADVRDFEDISERLADFYEEQGREDEANEIRKRIELDSAAVRHTLETRSGGKVLRQKTITTEEEGPPVDDLSKLEYFLRPTASKLTGGRRKIGRNQLCPCGSGRKFKKCCGGGG